MVNPMEAVRGETLGDHLMVGMYVCSIILGQPQGTHLGVHTPRGYRWGLGPGHPGVYPCPSLSEIKLRSFHCVSNYIAVRDRV